MQRFVDLTYNKRNICLMKENMKNGYICLREMLIKIEKNTDRKP